MAHQLLSAIALPNSDGSQTCSSLLIATKVQLGELPDISSKGVIHLLTLSGHVSLQTSTEYGQNVECLPLFSSHMVSKHHVAYRLLKYV